MKPSINHELKSGGNEVDMNGESAFHLDHLVAINFNEKVGYDSLVQMAGPIKGVSPDSCTANKLALWRIKSRGISVKSALHSALCNAVLPPVFASTSTFTSTPAVSYRRTMSRFPQRLAAICVVSGKPVVVD